MNRYLFIYRNMFGKVEQVSILAKNEDKAKDIFYLKYDGRIIAIEQV